jgi:dephospho-CoA kinase
VIVVGLAGQIACGKTEVARLFAEQGAAVISGDRLGREVVEANPLVRRRLAAEFGRAILTSNGRLRRRQLARLAFADPEKRAKLNQIVHPYLLRELRRRLRQQRGGEMLVVDAALIPEWDLQRELDVLIVVESTRKRQLARLQLRGLSRRESLDIIRRQVPKRQQRRLADVVLVNNGTLAELRRKALRVYKNLLKWVDKG